MNKAPTQANPTYAKRRVRHGPPNSVSTRIAKAPKAAKIEVCGCPITLSASAKTAGMTIAARAALLSAARSATADDDTGGRESAENVYPRELAVESATLLRCHGLAVLGPSAEDRFCAVVANS
jgi:hypothetical protein